MKAYLVFIPGWVLYLSIQQAFIECEWYHKHWWREGTPFPWHELDLRGAKVIRARQPLDVLLAFEPALHKFSETSSYYAYSARVKPHTPSAYPPV